MGSSSHEMSFVLILHRQSCLISPYFMRDILKGIDHHFVNVLEGTRATRSASLSVPLRFTNLACTTLQSSRIKSVIWNQNRLTRNSNDAGGRS
jgi:hypothetical protein